MLSISSLSSNKGAPARKPTVTSLGQSGQWSASNCCRVDSPIPNNFKRLTKRALATGNARLSASETEPSSIAASSEGTPGVQSNKD